MYTVPALWLLQYFSPAYFLAFPAALAGPFFLSLRAFTSSWTVEAASGLTEGRVEPLARVSVVEGPVRDGDQDSEGDGASLAVRHGGVGLEGESDGEGDEAAEKEDELHQALRQALAFPVHGAGGSGRRRKALRSRE